MVILDDLAILFLTNEDVQAKEVRNIGSIIKYPGNKAVSSTLVFWLRCDVIGGVVQTVVVSRVVVVDEAFVEIDHRSMGRNRHSRYHETNVRIPGHLMLL